MTRLLSYHTTKADPQHYWENSEVGVKLKNKELTNYDEYVKACKKAGCNCYIEECFNNHLKGL